MNSVLDAGFCQHKFHPPSGDAAGLRHLQQLHQVTGSGLICSVCYSSEMSRTLVCFPSMKRCHPAVHDAFPKKRKHFQQVIRLQKSDIIVVVFVSSAAGAWVQLLSSSCPCPGSLCGRGKPCAWQGACSREGCIKHFSASLPSAFGCCIVQKGAKVCAHKLSVCLPAAICKAAVCTAGVCGWSAHC